jgi:hypothetical protein
MLVVCPFCLHRKGVRAMSGDTSLGYVVANKFSMDPKKRQQIFAKCKKDDENLEKRKKEILENMLTNKTNQNLEKMILKARRVIKEKLRAKNFRKNYKQKSDIKR